MDCMAVHCHRTTLGAPDPAANRPIESPADKLPVNSGRFIFPLPHYITIQKLLIRHIVIHHKTLSK
jgi:hypothetical protein